MKSLPPLQEQTGHTCWGKVVETLDIDQNDSAKLKENILIINTNRKGLTIIL